MTSHFRVASVVAAAIALATSWQPADALNANFGAQTINLNRLLQSSSSSKLTARQQASFPQYTFTQPLDHFTNTGFTFEQRYWLSARHFNPNSSTPVPVIVLDGGETEGEDRLPYLDTGIVDILTAATGGIGVVLEHRYYGESVPVQNFTTDSLR